MTLWRHEAVLLLYLLSSGRPPSIRFCRPHNPQLPLETEVFQAGLVYVQHCLAKHINGIFVQNMTSFGVCFILCAPPVPLAPHGPPLRQNRGFKGSNAI